MKTRAKEAKRCAPREPQQHPAAGGCRTGCGGRISAGPQYGICPLTSFSPQILLMIELEAGLEEGPRTPTTPLGRIWHTVGSREMKRALDPILLHLAWHSITSCTHTRYTLCHLCPPNPSEAPHIPLKQSPGEHPPLRLSPAFPGPPQAPHPHPRLRTRISLLKFCFSWPPRLRTRDDVN